MHVSHKQKASKTNGDRLSERIYHCNDEHVRDEELVGIEWLTDLPTYLLDALKLAAPRQHCIDIFWQAA